MKIDPHNNKEGYLAWKAQAKSGIPEIGAENAALLLHYLQDMEIGVNVGKSAPKGARSFIHLRSTKDRLISIFKKVKARYGFEVITQITDEQIHLLFSEMANGVMLKPNGTKYKAVWDYVKIFKAFWHWHQRVQKKKGVEVLDITVDLDTRQEKPDWVYLTEEEVKTFTQKAKDSYRVLIWFLFDTGIRAPTELMNIRVSDFYNDFKELQIREEVSKTFGRRIKLMICSSLIKDYVKEKGLKGTDLLFTVNPPAVNQYLKRLAMRVFGDGQTQAGQRYCDLTMYDFRHISCCYWLPRYKSESALKYRFGWKKSDKIHYYSELLGMKDTISEEDMLLDVSKTQIEKDLISTRQENSLLHEELQELRMQMLQISELTKQLHSQIKPEGRGMY